MKRLEAKRITTKGMIQQQLDEDWGYGPSIKLLVWLLCISGIRNTSIVGIFAHL